MRRTITAAILAAAIGAGAAQGASGQLTNEEVDLALCAVIYEMAIADGIEVKKDSGKPTLRQRADAMNEEHDRYEWRAFKRMTRDVFESSSGFSVLAPLADCITKHG